MRALALDVGTRTLGVAISDPLLLFAKPVETITRTGRRADVARVLAIVRESGVGQIIVGLPIRTDGREGEGAQECRRMGAAVQEAAPGIPVEYLDERFTTQQALRVLDEAGLRGRRQRKAVVDQIAAVLILQDWLDRRSAGGGSPSS